MANKRIYLGLFVQALGHHVSGWRFTQENHKATDINWYIELAKKAEAARFDLFFLGDALSTSVHQLPSTMSRLEPLTLLSAVAVNTQHIGLAATVSTTFSDPFTTARAFSSLDHISQGRAAWNIVTSFSKDVANNFSLTDIPDHKSRYQRADEFLDVTNQLWKAWQPQAITANKKAGQYFDKSKINSIDHNGNYFQVKGPLTIEESPQKRPVLIAAGSSEDGQNFAAKHAEIIFTAAATLEEGKAFYTQQKNKIREQSRQPNDVFIMPGVMPIVGRTKQEALDTWNNLNEHVDIGNGLTQLSTRFNVDLRAYPIDGPLPEIPLGEGNQSRVRLLVDMAKREQLTIRQLAARAASSRGHRVIVGTATEIADDFEQWINEEAADGFNIMPAILPEQLDLFIELVIPELQQRGLFLDRYQTKTLRKNLQN